jgi:hypothetical protein
MLRRKPTALTVTADDIAALEEQLAQRQAYNHYVKTGEDPHGLFTQTQQRRSATTYEAHMQSYNQSQGYGQRPVSSGAMIDPNDELKPLPGAKASIVRAKDERIIGTGTMSRAGPGRP